MSNGIVCDNCGEVLVVNERGDAENGEEAAWLKIITSVDRYDLCSRACAVVLLDDPDFVERMDTQLELIASIAHAIIGETDEDQDAP